MAQSDEPLSLNISDFIKSDLTLNTNRSGSSSNTAEAAISPPTYVFDATDSFTLGSFTTAHHSPVPKHEPLERIIHYLMQMPVQETDITNEEYELHMQNLSEIVLKCVKAYKDPSFIRIIKAYGWIGQRFSSDRRMFDRSNLLQAISNLYLKFQYKMSESLENILDTNSNSQEINHLEKIASFCPDIVLDYVSNNAEAFFSPGNNPPSFTFVGACMLVDISGFSKFSASMCSKGIHGLDELRKATSGLLGQFVKEVYEHDGDVIAFAGDALICIFTDSKNKKKADDKDEKREVKSLHKVDACFRALHCANILRSVQFIELSTHIGISYGEMKMAFLGGYNGQWVHLMNGKCLSQLSSCLDDAASQMVVVTEECYDHLISLYEVVESPAISRNEINIITSTDDISFEIGIEPSTGNSPGDRPSSIKMLRNMSTSPQSYIDYPRITMNRIGNSGNYRLTTLVESREFNNLLNIMGRIGFIAAIKTGSTPKATAATSYQKMTRKKSTRTLSMHKLSVDELYDAARREITEKKRKFVEALTLFIPIPVMSALRSESNHHLGELRTVTTMFLCLDSYSPELYSDPQSLQPFFLIAQQAMVDTGGFLRQFLVDDKGCVLIAMWGMPSYTYANNCSRALYCAHMIQQKTKTISIDCSIGITTGTVFCGTIGAAERCDYVGIGTEVNLAARLMAKAHGDIFVDEATYGNLNEENRSLLQVGNELTLKGMPRPIRPYVYTSTDSPLLENIDAKTREKKSKLLKKKVMQLLEKQLDAIANTMSLSGSPRTPYKAIAKTPRTKSKKLIEFKMNNVNFTILCGQPGSGKSTAVEYFQISARERGIQIIHIKAQSHHRNIPYAVMKEIFLELVGPENFESPLQQKIILDNLFREAFETNNVGDDDMYDDSQLRDVREAIELLLGVDTSLVGSGELREERMTRQVSDDGSIHLSKYGDVFLALTPKNRLNVTAPFQFDQAEDSKNRSDLSFYKLLAVLLANTPIALVIENAHFCDELTWNELLLILVGFDLEMSVLLTSKSQHYTQPASTYNNSNNSSTMPTSNSSNSIAVTPTHMSNRSRTNSFNNNLNCCENSNGVSTPTNSSGTAVVVPPLNISQSVNTFHPTSSFVNHFPVRIQTRLDVYNADEVNDQLHSTNEQRLQSFGLSFIDFAAFHAITAHANCVIYEMKSLGEDDVRAMLLNYLKVDSVSPQLVRLVSDVSSGNSYWCKMIAQFIKDQGVAYLENAIQAQYGVNDNSSAIMNSIIPPSPSNSRTSNSSNTNANLGAESRSNLTGPQVALRSLILCRMEILSTENQTVLKYISVIGSEFTVQLIEAILPPNLVAEMLKGSNKRSVPQVLEAIEKHCFIHCISEYPTLIYAFQNDLIQRTIYELLPPSDAAAIHITIAKYLEREFVDSLRPFYPSLAYHYRMGQDKAKSFKYEIKAAALAVSSGAYNDGLSLTEKALTLLEFPAQVSVVLEVTDRALDDLKLAESPTFFSRFSQSFYTFMNRGNNNNSDYGNNGNSSALGFVGKVSRNTSSLLLQVGKSPSGNNNVVHDEKMEFSVSFSKKQNSVHQANIAAFRVLRAKAEQIQHLLLQGISAPRALSTTLLINIPETSSLAGGASSSPSPVIVSPNSNRTALTPLSTGSYRMQLEDIDNNDEIVDGNNTGVGSDNSCTTVNVAGMSRGNSSKRQLSSTSLSPNSNSINNQQQRLSTEAKAELLKVNTTTKKLSWQPSFMDRTTSHSNEEKVDLSHDFFSFRTSTTNTNNTTSAKKNNNTSEASKNTAVLGANKTAPVAANTCSLCTIM